VPTLRPERDPMFLKQNGLENRAQVRHSSFADEAKQHANGAIVLHFSRDRITDYQFTLHPTDLANRFTSIVAPMVEKIDTLANKIKNLCRTRDLLLRLLTGQLEI